MMKNNLKTLNKLIKQGHVRPDDFYAINITNDKVRLQGVLDAKKEKRYSECFGLMESDWHKGWLEGKLFNVELILTD